ncbi:FHA domain protein [Rosistilla carotiformis]|uniref:FHA domain protein n=1 Tax=Rosistilla carotiformis TaxID=2528017 RepID=A0A518JQD6_9BACT|nr:FHA domain-containing protein [Rosistilla carotiformis]QDV67753.1 FHA domain protein [Rosistilla carotiformis]
MNTWIIGRNPLCDVVVDHADVADRHCLLRQTVGGFLLDDLGSKCGTFVDEHRITHPVLVTHASQITLGTSTPFVWPSGIDPQAVAEACEAAESVLFRVGRFPDNDLVLDRDMISGRHAVLVVQRDRIVIEDLGSTNGTAVGTIDNKIQSAEVRERDRVFFGSFSIMVTHLLAMSRKTKPPETVIEQPVEIQAAKVHSKFPIKRSMQAAAGLLAIVGAFQLVRTGLRDPVATPPSGPTSPVAASLPPAKVLAVPPSAVPDEKADLLATREKDQTAGPMTLSDAADALFMVIVTGDSKQIAFHIGTAWLAEADRLVTSGAVVSAIKEQDDSGFSHVQVVQTSSGNSFDVATVSLDADLAKAKAEYARGRQLYSELQAEMKALQLRGDSADRLEEARRESQAIIEAGLQSTSIRASLNVGWLELTNPVPEAQPAQLANDSDLKVGQRLHMHAAPFQLENPAWDPANTMEPHGIVVRVEERIVSPNKKAPDRWLMSMASSGPPQSYVGSPILTRQGHVVAMFSRPMVDGAENDSPYLFEAVSVQCVSPAAK